MSLFILRHEIAEERCPHNFPDDSRRPLTDKGEDRILKICEALQKLKLRFDVILTSPFHRARSTAEIVARRMRSNKPPRLCEELKPGGDIEALIREIKILRPGINDILVVGHEPDLSHLVSRLISGRPEALLELKKGGLAKLRFPRTHQPGHFATLAWLLTPRQLLLLAGSPAVD